MPKKRKDRRGDAGSRKSGGDGNSLAGDYGRWLPWVGLLCIVLLFVWIKSDHLFWEDTPEVGLYYYAKLMHDGRQPYTDFIMQDTPALALVYERLFGFFGLSRFALKGFALLLTVLCGVLVFLSTRHLSKNLWTALLSSGLFFFAAKVMLDAAVPSTYALAAFLFIVAFYLYVRTASVFWAAVLFSLGVFAQLAAWPVLLFFFLHVWSAQRRALVRALWGALAGLLVPVAVCLLLWRGQFVVPLLASLSWGGSPSSSLSMFYAFARLHLILFLGFVVYIFMRKSREVSLAWWIVLAQCVLIILMGSVVTVPYLMIVPLLAVVAGVAVSSLMQLVVRSRDFLALLVVVLLVVAFIPARVSLQRTFDARKFADFGPWAEYIAQNSEEHDAIGGFSTLVPLLALHANRSVYLDIPLLSSKMFEDGLLDKEVFVQRFGRQPPKFFVAEQGALLNRDTVIAPVVTQHCELVRSSAKNEYLLLACQ